MALLGPSGSGKSTVLNMIATLVKPSNGQILIDGKPVIAGKATPGVGYVFQRDTLFPGAPSQTISAMVCNWQASVMRSGRNGSRPASRKRDWMGSATPIRRPCPAACASAQH